MSNKPISRLLFCLFWGFCLLLLNQPIYAQDLGFSYQAIARNNNGDPITSQNLTVTIQLRRSSANGSIAYQEEHSVQTNALGLFTLTIGEGNATTGSFNSLAWGGNTYFVVVGINGNSIGGTRLEAVPYSKVATHMDLQDLLDVNNGTPASGQVLTWNGSEWEAQNAQSGFSPVAGDGIQINGNTITNTGDTNPNNDITNSSQAGGDLSGNFGDLNIRNNTIGTANIINGSITEDDISSGTEIPGPPTGSAGQDLRGTYPNPFVSGIQGRPVQNVGPAEGEVLTWDTSIAGGSWTPKAVESSGGDPTGPVGGDLDGNLPNPAVAGLRGRPVQDIQPLSNQVLTWNGTQWTPGNIQVGAASGDVSGTYPSLTVDGLQGNTVSATAPTLNQVLTWNGLAWIPADAQSSAGGPPTGTAGGDLEGAYPNPTVDGLQGRTVTANAPSLNQVLTWNGIAWTPEDVPSTGGPPSGTAGGDLGGAYPNPTVDGLQGNSVSATAPAINQVLTWNGTTWIPADAPGSGGGPPTGVAGGDLGGSYPNPTVDGLQGRAVQDIQPTSRQVLTWTGTVWAPSNIDIGNAAGDVSGPYTGLTVGGLQGNAVSATVPTLNQVLTWNGSTWIPADAPSSGGGPPTGTAGGDLGGAYPNPTVDGLQGNAVSATVPTLNQVLTWNGSTWIPADAPSSGGGPPTGTAGGDLGGAYPNPTVDGLQGNAVSATVPTLNQVLTWNGSTWIPADAPSSGGGPPTGTAGGDLGGAYPNPTVDGLQGNTVSATTPALNQALIWDGSAWTPADIPDSGGGSPTGAAGGDLSGTYPNPTIGTLQGNTLTATSPTLNQVLTWNGSAWVPADVPDSGGGSPTGAAGGDLGGTYPNPSVAGLQGNTVSATTPALNQALIWNGSAWEPADIPDSGGGSPTGAAGGDLSGTYPNPTIGTLQGNTLTATSPTLNQVLTWNGSAWVPADVPDSGGGSPSGAAGGDLGGTYPNPSVASLQGNAVSATSPTLNQVLTWNGSTWAPADDQSSGGGSPTGAAGGDLSGTYPNPTIGTLQGNTVNASSPSANQVLTWSGSEWSPQDVPATTPGNADGDVTGAYDALVVEKLRGQDISTTAPSAVDQVLTWNGSEWAPKTFASLVSSGNFSNFSASNSSPLLRQTQSTQTLTLAPNTNQDILSLAISTTEKACALITIGGEASIQEGAGGGYANLEYGLRDNASLQSPVSHATLAIPEGYPSGTSFFHNLYFSRLVAIPAGGTTVTAFAQNSPNGESISLDNLSMVAQIITDESNNCNE